MIDILWPLAGAGAAAALVAVVTIARRFIYVCRPSQVLILTGREHMLPDGSKVGYMPIHGGWVLRKPFVEEIEVIDLTTIPIDIRVTNAYSKGNIPLTLSAVGYVKVSSDLSLLANAVERFLGQPRSEIQRVAKESLEGHIRGVLARMTPEEVNEDRLKFAELLMHEAGEDLDRLGIQLDAIKVQSVQDDVSYLDSIGRERLAQVIQAAEIAESTAKADAEQAQATANQRGQIASEQSKRAIQVAENQLREAVAKLEAQARSEEERAEQGALAARAVAEFELQEIRARREHLRLSADVVLPAEAERQAMEMRAKAGAATTAADGKAMAEVLVLMKDAWVEAGDDARDIFLIQQLEPLLKMVSARIKTLNLGEVTLIDGGDGTALPNHIAALPATVAAVFRSFRETTGVDVTGILAGSARRTEVK